MKVVNMLGHEVQVDCFNAVFRSAIRPNDLLNDTSLPIRSPPVALKLGKLREVSKFPIFYMRKILTAFESKHERDITGLSFRYDGLRDSIRPFGFLTFKDHESMIRYHKNGVRAFDEMFQAVESHHVSVILSEPNKHLLDTSNVYSQPVHDANLICGIFCDLPVCSTQEDAGEAAGLEAEATMNEEISDADSVISLSFGYDFDNDDKLIKL
jgi:hypothetical protein